MARVSAAESCPILQSPGSRGSSPSTQRVSGSSPPSTPCPLAPTLRAARCCRCPTYGDGRPTPGPPSATPSSPPRNCSRTSQFLSTWHSWSSLSMSSMLQDEILAVSLMYLREGGRE